MMKTTSDPRVTINSLSQGQAPKSKKPMKKKSMMQKAADKVCDKYEKKGK